MTEAISKGEYQMFHYSDAKIKEICNEAVNKVDNDDWLTDTEDFHKGYNSALADISRIIDVNVGHPIHHTVEAIVRYIQLHNLNVQ